MRRGDVRQQGNELTDVAAGQVSYPCPSQGLMPRATRLRAVALHGHESWLQSPASVSFDLSRLHKHLRGVTENCMTLEAEVLPWKRSASASQQLFFILDTIAELRSDRCHRGEKVAALKILTVARVEDARESSELRTEVAKRDGYLINRWIQP